MKIPTKHDRPKNPNWQEADQLAIYKNDWGVELQCTVYQEATPAKWPEWDLNLRPPDFKSSIPTTKPHCKPTQLSKIPLCLNNSWTEHFLHVRDMFISLSSIPKCRIKQLSVFDKFTHHQFDPHSFVSSESLTGLKLVFHRKII